MGFEPGLGVVAGEAAEEAEGRRRERHRDYENTYGAAAREAGRYHGSVMRVILFGATGMVGSGVLLECLADPRVRSVLSLVRRRSGVTDPKLEGIVHDDLIESERIKGWIVGWLAVYFYLVVSAR